MMKKSFFALAVSGLALAGSPAFAAGTYLIGQVGKANVDAGDGVYARSLDDDDTYFGISIGFRVTENLGFEIGYHDFGKIEAKYSGANAEGFGGGTESLALDAVSVAAVGTLPLGPSVSVYGKVGVDLWNAEWKDSYHDVTVTFGPYSSSDKVSDDGADVFFALGAAFDISAYSSIFIEYQAHQFDVSGTAYDTTEVDLKTDINTVSVGINYNF